MDFFWRSVKRVRETRRSQGSGSRRTLAAWVQQLERRDLLTLTPIPASVNFIAGVSPSTPVIIGSFLDSNTAALTGDFTATINWGDGHTTAGTILPTPTAGRFDIDGTNLYLTPNTYTVAITVNDFQAHSATIDSTAFVAAPALTPIGATATFVTGVQPGTPVPIGSFLDSNPNAVPGNFTATITWGNGQSSSGVVTASTTTGLFVVSGTNLYTNTGIYPILISVQDNLGDSINITSTALVNTNQVYGFTGGLANSIVNGPLAANGYTNTNRPTFSGTAAPFAIVQLYARYLNVDAELPLGEAVASANGQWTLTTGPLARGVSVVTAVVTIPAGYPSTAMTLSNQNGTNLVYIDLAPAPVKRPPHRRVEAPHPKIHTTKPAMLKPHGPRHL
jgi:hypothetical protein